MEFKSKRIKAAVFDMDGTMFDTERLRMEMIQEASELIFGQPVSEEYLVDCLGISAKAAEALAKERYGAHFPYAKIRSKADELEIQYVRAHGVPVKNGLIDVLERLKKNGLLLAVATSSKHSIAEEYLMNAAVMSYFDIIVCGDEVSHGKPDPEIFNKAISELNCEASDCLIFEDSQNGLLAALAAEANTVFIKDMIQPAPEILAKVFARYDSMTDFLDELIFSTTRLPVPQLTEEFPQRYNNLKAGIHGFGAIGGGYLTQVFSHWDGYTRPNEIIGACKNKNIRNLINATGWFHVYYESAAYKQTITNLRLIDIFDEEEMTRMYTDCAIVGLCLPESAIPSQAETIAKGLLARRRQKGGSLTVLVVLNKIGGGTFVKNLVRKKMLQLTSAEETKEIMNKTYFCETVVNRMVSKVASESLLKQLYLSLQTFNSSMQEKWSDVNLLIPNPAGKKREKQTPVKSVPDIKSTGEHSHLIQEMGKKLSGISTVITESNHLELPMFNSETEMVLYASNESPFLYRLRQVKPTPNISLMQDIKNKLSNGTHAIIAWYAGLLGYKTIGQGMGDKQVLSLVRSVMRKEIKPALLNSSSDEELTDYIDELIRNFIKRCRYSFRDPCTRVGRDPMRKLQLGERVMGTIALAEQSGIETPGLELGAAAGLLYAIRNIDPTDKESAQIRGIYHRRHSIADVLTYSGPYNGKSYRGLNKNEHADLIRRIEKQFNEFEFVLKKAEAIAAK